MLNYCNALVARVSPPSFENEIADEDTRATNSALRTPGYRVTYLTVERDGLLKLADLEAAIPRLREQTAVVSLTRANRIGVRCWGLDVRKGL